MPAVKVAAKTVRAMTKRRHEIILTFGGRIIVWLDSCSPFYGVYEKQLGEAQLRGEVVKQTLE